MFVLTLLRRYEHDFVWTCFVITTFSFFSYTVPPRVIEEFSPSSVICEKKTPCLVSCQATSYIPFNYSWTRDGQVPTGDNIKLMNNSLIVTPRDAQDYGEYVCHVTNAFGSTLYKIILLDSEGRFFLIFRSLEFLGVYYSSLHRFKHLCIKSNIIWWSHTPTFSVQYRSITPCLKIGLLDFNLIKTELCALILRGLKVKICLYFSY